MQRRQAANAAGTRHAARLHFLARFIDRDGGLELLTAELVKVDDHGALWSDREIARRCKVGYTLVEKLRDEVSFDTTRAGSMERTFAHPKTGQPTTMRTCAGRHFTLNEGFP